jgi:SAM-dependent methyltransferase
MNNQLVKEASKKLWGTNPAGATYGETFQKGSKEFFEAILAKRFMHECDWLDEIVKFERFNNKEVLEIGCGAGYDAYQFCKNGALYTGIDITPENIVLSKKHLSYFGYTPHILEMDAELMSFSDSFDYIYSFGVLHHIPDIKKVVYNMHTALKKGGEAQIIVYHKHSIFYLIWIVLFDWILNLKFLKMTLKQRLSQIEFTTEDVVPLVNVYGKKELVKLIESAGFFVIKVDVRKLTIEDLPYIPLVSKLYKYIPKTWLDTTAKQFGWYISVRASKC